MKEDLDALTHTHVFGESSLAAERGTRLVVLITAAMMVVEIIAGWWFNSMALLADGWHMSSHALAIGLSALAYTAARRFAHDPRFAFGTWKIEVLAGFVSALFLLAIAAWMVYGSVERLLRPQPIDFEDAIAIAVLGLVVNVVCALILDRAHRHDHVHGHAHHAHHAHAHRRHRDLNLKAAYIHVITDAATSVLAILALAGGMLWGWHWLDPLMGIVGAALVALWARGLVSETALVLLDCEMHHPIVEEVRTILGQPGWAGATRVADLHVWRVGRHSYACIVVLVTSDPTLTPRAVRTRLAVHPEIEHVTVEIHFLESGTRLA